MENEDRRINTGAGVGADLRQLAETAAAGEIAPAPDRRKAIPPDDAQRMLHSLRVHQIELEMQNEELRRTQVELDAARARYFDLYDLAPVAYFTVSEAGLILEANLTAATLLGVTRSALVSRPISRFIVHADQDIYYLHRNQLLTSGESQSCELRMMKHDGTPFWARLVDSGAQDPDGTPVHRLVLSDITDRKLMEAAMQESEQRFRTLIEWSPEPIAVHRDGKLVYVNPAAISLFGARSAQDLIGHPFFSLVHPDFHETALARMKSVVELGVGTPMIEMQFLKLDGTTIGVEVQSISIAYDGAPAIQIAMRDITQRQLLDQVLQEKNVELECAKLVAEKANRAKSDFLSSMSHELRSPLNAILGFAQLMEVGSPPPTPTQKARISQILQAGWYLLELINEILDLALIESGKLSLSLEPVSLADVLRDCRTMIEAQAEKSGIRLSLPPVDPACFVKADRTHLKQALINLLSNAIKYNRAGGAVDVRCSAVTAQRLRISVQDGGEGLSPDKLTQLFQPFNRLGQEAGAIEGTGIGLVVCKRLVELMEGEIGVQSKVGVGSEFWIELNLAPAPQLDTDADTLLAQAPAHDHQPGAAMRTLLYVEDNQANMELVAQLVARRPDLRLLSAGDGMSGIALARTHQPQVILMDINLPDISGIEALKILRQDPTTKHIPVLAISANAIPRDIEKGLAAGFTCYLTKPFKVNEFMQALDQALGLATQD
jgi:PAS domain S-box-containing protein